MPTLCCYVSGPSEVPTANGDSGGGVSTRKRGRGAAAVKQEREGEEVASSPKKAKTEKAESQAGQETTASGRPRRSTRKS